MSRSGTGSEPLPFPRRPDSTGDAGRRNAHAPPLPNNLPAHLTPFIGRHAEVDAVCALIADESVRLLTLTGPGGVGKTRLALRAAEELLPEFEDGAFFVALAPLTDPELVLLTIAQALGLRDDGVTPLNERLREHLRDKAILLVLDNFEHVASATPLVTSILFDTPGVQVIVTTRIALHLYGEHEYHVPPMSVPDPQVGAPQTAVHVGGYEAIQLFVARASEVRHDFALADANAAAIAGICRRLDGLPLAIELAAARTRLFSPEALLARLGKSLPFLTSGALDLPERQQTLRNAIAWSYDLLDSVEQALFARLSVFAGGCTIDAVAHVAHDLGLEEGALLDKLESLIDKNLLRQREQPDGEPRFWMLATLREYAVEKLLEEGEPEAARRSHAEYFLAMVERFATELRGPQQATWLERLETEHDNLRAALTWATYKARRQPHHSDGSEDSPDRDDRLPSPIEWAVRLGGSVWWFWFTHGHISEGRRWLDRILDIATAEETKWDAQIRSKMADVFNGAGSLAGTQGDYARASAMLVRSLEITRGLGNKRGVARTLNNLGIFLTRQGAYAEAELAFRESFDLKEEIGDEVGLSAAYNRLAEMAHVRGDYEEANRLYEQSLALRKARDDKAWIADTLQNMAASAFAEGDLDRAVQLAQECATLSQEVEYKEAEAIALACLGEAVWAQGDNERAASLLERSLELSRTSGDQSNVSLALQRLGQVAANEQDYERAHVYFLQALQIRRRLGEYNAEMAETLEWIAYLEARQQPERTGPEGATRAAILLGAAEAQREAMGAPIQPVSRHGHSRSVKEVRARVGRADFDVAWQRGRAMTFEHAAAFALHGLVVLSHAQAPPAPDPPTATPRLPGLDLTDRELEVLRLLAQGLTNKEIGERLALSHRTVQAHLYNIFSKLNVTTRSAATRAAIERGIV